MANELMAVRSVKLPRKLLNDVIKRAERERRTVSAMMRILIEEAMKSGSRTTRIRPAIRKNKNSGLWYQPRDGETGGA